MSFVTFVRDYIQDPDRIIHFPNFIFDCCKNFFLYIFSFQWLHNLTYVTLARVYDVLPVLHTEGVALDQISTHNEVMQALQEEIGNGKKNIDNFHSWASTFLPDANSLMFGHSGGDPLHHLYPLSSLSLADLSETGIVDLAQSNIHQFSFIYYFFYGLLNGITSTFHFCALTILLAHILLNENKKRAFRVALVACFADFTHIIFVSFGARSFVFPLVAAEPASYILGFTIQIFFALAIIKDNRRIVSSKKITSFGSQISRNSGGQESKNTLGQLSSNYWLLFSVFLFSWCEQTQLFSNFANNSFQPTATLLGVPFDPLTTNDNLLGAFGQRSIYCLAFLFSRIVITWIVLLIFQQLIEWKDNGFGEIYFWNPLSQLNRKSRSEIGVNTSSWRTFLRRFSIPGYGRTQNTTFVQKMNSSASVLFSTQGEKTSNLLRDPLAIAAVTCSLAFLPAYSENFIAMKSIGFFPDENRTQHSIFSPWDMPAQILGMEEDAVGEYHNLAEYPFFLPFYDKGEWGGWLGVGEEDIRYGPLKLWQTRRIRAPWRRTTLQEPALTFSNDKSLLVDPTKKARREETINIKTGLRFDPIYSNLAEKIPCKASLCVPLTPKGGIRGNTIDTPYEGKEEETNFVDYKYFKKQRSTRNTYIKLLTLDYLEGLNVESSTLRSLSTLDKQRSFLSSLPVPNEVIQAPQKGQLKYEPSSNNFSMITKGGRKKLIERFQKTVKKWNTSKLFDFRSKNSFVFMRQPSSILASPKKSVKSLSGQKLISTVTEGVTPHTPKGGSVYASLMQGVLQKSVQKENTIKNNRQIRKRFKKYKRRFREFLTHSYKKRSSKIKRLKHFHNLRNKKKKRRQSKRLVSKLRRQYPYLRNVKKRKTKKFGFYSALSKKPSPDSSIFLGDSLLTPKAGSSNASGGEITYSSSLGLLEESSDTFVSSIHRDAWGIIDARKQREYSAQPSSFQLYTGNMYSLLDNLPYQSTNKSVIKKTFNVEKTDIAEGGKSSYSTAYPHRKNDINLKKDWGLIFRTQIGERLDFAREEIRARIFLNPYTRFLLNNKIDHFLARENFPKISFQSRDAPSVLPVRRDASRKENVLSTGDARFSSATGNNFIEIKEIGDFEAQENFVPPVVKNNKNSKPANTGPLTSAAEQNLFKRRMLISKYADAVDFLKPNSKHSYVDKVYNHQFKGTLSTARRLFSLKIQFDQPLLHSLGYKPAIRHEELNFFESPITQEDSVEKTKISGTVALEKTCLAPLYAAWDPLARKLVLTNRFLDYKTTTRSADLLPSFGNDLVFKPLKQFSSWPLKESYFKENEFLMSQLYSNSQPIDSFLSQEREKSRPMALPRRVNKFNSFSTVSNHKKDIQPGEAQRSQQFLKLEDNDKKTFLFKHFWDATNSANASGNILEKNKTSNRFSYANYASSYGGSLRTQGHTETLPIFQRYKIPASAEQRRLLSIDEREYPLWMALRALPPNQGGFLWPGD